MLVLLEEVEALQVQTIDAQTISSTTKVATRNSTGATAMVVAIAAGTTTTVEVEQAEVQAPTFVEMQVAMISTCTVATLIETLTAWDTGNNSNRVPRRATKTNHSRHLPIPE